MTFRSLILRNLLYHWRGNLAVLLGVLVGSAVLSGALFVGDSLTGSLRARAEQQLGWVDHVLVGPHLLHESIAHEVDASHACPMLVMQGSATMADKDWPRAGSVSIYGVDNSFWYRCDTPVESSFWDAKTSPRDRVVLSRELADSLHVREGDRITLLLPKLSLTPRESALGHRDVDRARTIITLTVASVLDADHFGSHFSLRPAPGRPQNAFLPLAALQQVLQDAADEDRTPVQVKDHVNALLAAGNSEALRNSLRQHLTLDDWGLALRDPETRTRALFAQLARPSRPNELRPLDYDQRIGTDLIEKADTNHDRQLSREEVLDCYRKYRGYLSLESSQMLLDPYVDETALTVAADSKLKAAPTFVYLADSLNADGQSRNYVLVAAVDPNLPAPVEPLIPAAAASLKDSEILLVNWPKPLLDNVIPGATIRMSYYDPDKEDKLHKDVEFTLKGFVPQDAASTDPDMTPSIPGVTDRKGLNWDLPRQLHYEESRRHPDDTEYWNVYRTTPRAYITLERARSLWKNRFGDATSIRAVPEDGRDLTDAAAAYRTSLLEKLDPERGGMAFDPVRDHRVNGAAQSNDFAMLFLGFSCFLIVAALLLVGLLFRLNLERRAGEIGLLLSLGYRRATVRSLLLVEGAMLSAVGALLGLAAALLYARFLLALLRWWWPEHLDESFLQLHVSARSACVGFIAILAVAMLTIFWVVRSLSRVSARALLAGSTTEDRVVEGAAARTTLLGRITRPILDWRVVIVMAALLAVSSSVAGYYSADAEAKAGSFFAAGMFLLAGLLASLWARIRRTTHALIAGHGPAALARLGVRNAARFPLRSLLTAGLLASAAFVVVAVQSFRKEIPSDDADHKSGSGGITLLAWTTLPIYHDLQSEDGRNDVLGQLRQRLQDRKLPAPTVERNVHEELDDLKQCRIYSCRLKDGDDASCLNLAQPRRPRILGLPKAFEDDDRFRFAQSLAETPEERKNPWLLLDRPSTDGAIPVILDATTAEWTLHTGLGKTLTVPGRGDMPLTLKVVGLLQESIFQSEVLMSSTNFENSFPDVEGYRFFLIDAPTRAVEKTQSLLSGTGFDVEPASQRLQAYLEVENTYLATFQALGALGLLLGTLGLGIVLLRSVWERRGELALLRALGYRRGQLGWLILAENAYLLLTGLAVGTLAALVAITPEVWSGAGEVPWLRLFAMLALVAAVGLAAGSVAVATSLRAELIPALRRE